jgi:hypothetical protein
VFLRVVAGFPLREKEGWFEVYHSTYIPYQAKKSETRFSSFLQNARFDVNLPASDAGLFRIAYRNDSVYLYIKNGEKKRFFGEIFPICGNLQKTLTSFRARS